MRQRGGDSRTGRAAESGLHDFRGRPPGKPGRSREKTPARLFPLKLFAPLQLKFSRGDLKNFPTPPLLNFSGSSDSFSQLGQYIPKLLTNFCDVFGNLMSSKIMTLFICIVFLPPGYYYYSYSFFFLIPNITITKLCLWNLHWRSSQNLSLIPFLIVLETTPIKVLVRYNIFFDLIQDFSKSSLKMIETRWLSHPLQ